MTPDAQQLVSFIMILARVSAFIAFLPLFAQKQLPNLVKSGLAVGLTLFWFSTVPDDQLYRGSPEIVGSLLAIAKEIGIGFVLATLFGWLLVPARIAGAYVGQEMGLSLASVSSPGTADSSTLLTTIFETFAVLLFFALDLHHVMILLLHHSMLQMGSDVSLLEMPTELVVNVANSVTKHGVVIAGSVGLVLLMLTVALALLNRAAPSLNLFSVGTAMRAGLGVVCLLLFFPVILDAIAANFESHLFELESFLTSFGE
ncbi:MAG: flagellar biosynthetic protein FliR [Planctomycetota bacterium]